MWDTTALHPELLPASDPAGCPILCVLGKGWDTRLSVRDSWPRFIPPRVGEAGGRLQEKPHEVRQRHQSRQEIRGSGVEGSAVSLSRKQLRRYGLNRLPKKSVQEGCGLPQPARPQRMLSTVITTNTAALLLQLLLRGRSYTLL